MIRSLLALSLLSATASTAPAQRLGSVADGAPSSAIRLDQIGFLPAAPKGFVVVGASDDRFVVLDATRGDTVIGGRLQPARVWRPSGETVRRGAFDALHTPGRYVVAVAGIGRSTPFAVAPDVFHDLARAAIKAFYYQRASTDLPAAYAGRWSRAGGHPDTAVLVHASAAGPGRPAGTTIRSPGGWYDAGDYNKYVVNSGISTYTLLLLAEQFPGWAERLRTNIPESGNAVPDVLDEALWNLRWMSTMQDPVDGGVYHKLTNAEFDPFIAPSRATTPRYVVQKSTAATLDFAAVCAHAALVVARYPTAFPALADSLRSAALRAWSWARRHPDVVYDQQAVNARYSPAINTGSYGDRRLDDEWQWAASELFLATHADSFLVMAAPLAPPTADVPGWSSVRTLGLYSLVEHRRELPASFDRAALEARLVALARTLAEVADTSAYGVPIGAPGDFVWGSNAVDANQGMALIEAFRLTRHAAYLRAAIAALDYVLGRNATGYSFVTGYGVRTPMHPHHRLSSSDTVDAPVPGLLVGGPNPGQQDHCPGYPSKMPALSYVDEVCAYAANEIAINWNAPLAFLAGAIDAIATRPAAVP